MTENLGGIQKYFLSAHGQSEEAKAQMNLNLLR